MSVLIGEILSVLLTIKSTIDVLDKHLLAIERAMRGRHAHPGSTRIKADIDRLKEQGKKLSQYARSGIGGPVQ